MHAALRPTRRNWRPSLLAGTALSAFIALSPVMAAAQAPMTGVVIRGPVAGGPGNGAMPLVAGQPVRSPASAWTEIAFPDGTSIVLEPGASFTLRSVTRDAATGRTVLAGEAPSGRLRLSAAEGVEIRLATPGAEVRVADGAAVVEAGAAGSAMLLSGRPMTVLRADGRRDEVRRPGFLVAFDDGGPRRRSREQLAAAVEPFAPVQTRAAPAPAPRQVAEAPAEIAEAPPARERAEQRVQRQRNETVAPPTGGARQGGIFGLAGAALGASATAVSLISAPTPSGATSTSTGVNFAPLPGSPPGDPITGVASQQRFGPARLRSLGPPSGRSDTGLREVAVGSLRVGTSAFSTEAAADSFDAIARVAVTSVNTVIATPVSGAPILEVPWLGIGAGYASAIVYANPNYGFRSFPAVETVEIAGQSFERRGLYIAESASDPGRPAVVLDGMSLSDQGFTTAVQLALQRAASGETGPLLPATSYDPIEVNGTTYQRYSIYEQLVGGEQLFINGQTLSSSEFREELRQGAERQASGEAGEIITRADRLVGRYFPPSVLDVALSGERPPDLTPLGPDAPRGVPAVPGVVPATWEGVPPPSSGQIFAVDGLESRIVVVSAAAIPGNRLTYALANDGVRPGLNPNLQVDKAPAVFLIDAFVPASPQPERIFVIGGTPVAARSQGLPGAAPLEAVRFAISDGLNPLGGFAPGEIVENRFAGPNATSHPISFNRFNSFRPDETFVIRPDNLSENPAGRGDTHLLVVAGGNGQPNVALRGEIEVTAGGTSSLSVSVGGIGVHGASLVLSGNTVGTARLETTGDVGSTAIASRLGSLGTDAAGVEAHIFPNATTAAEADPAPGHFAVGQQDIRRGTPGSDEGQPGRVEAIDNPTGGYDFAFTRLATNVSVVPGAGSPIGGPRSEAAVTLQGFAAGIVESVVPGRNPPIALHGASTAGLGGVTIQRAEGANEFAASINLQTRAAGELAVNPLAATAPAGVPAGQSLAFGGRDAAGTPTTAWIGNGSFGAVRPGSTVEEHRTRADGAAMVSVDGSLRAGIAGLPDTMPNSTDHLAWGMFLGDLVNEAPGAGSRRDHVNLGFWVAGRPVTTETLATLRGTASFSGGMIGNVAQDGSLRTATGSFTQNWDFGARRGTLDANFDQRAYNVRAAMPGGSNVFTGSGLTGDRRMVVQGAFFQGQATTAPASVGGTFGITGGGYAANGIFVGRRN